MTVYNFLNKFPCGILLPCVINKQSSEIKHEYGYVLESYLECGIFSRNICNFDAVRSFLYILEPDHMGSIFVIVHYYWDC